MHPSIEDILCRVVHHSISISDCAIREESFFETSATQTWDKCLRRCRQISKCIILKECLFPFCGKSSAWLLCEQSAIFCSFLSSSFWGPHAVFKPIWPETIQSALAEAFPGTVRQGLRASESLDAMVFQEYDTMWSHDGRHGSARLERAKAKASRSLIPAMLYSRFCHSKQDKFYSVHDHVTHSSGLCGEHLMAVTKVSMHMITNLPYCFRLNRICTESSRAYVLRRFARAWDEYIPQSSKMLTVENKVRQNCENTNYDKCANS